MREAVLKWEQSSFGILAARNTAGLAHRYLDLGGVSMFFIYGTSCAAAPGYRVLASGHAHYDMPIGRFTELDDAKEWCERRNEEMCTFSRSLTALGGTLMGPDLAVRK